jgi:hypothetical protein
MENIIKSSITILTILDLRNSLQEIYVTIISCVEKIVS